MTVWVLVAVMRLHEIVGGHISEYINVYATASACERDRAKMQTVDHDAKWKCIRQEPKR